MPRNFYFGKDADIVAKSANFATLLAANFADYGLTEAQSDAFGVVNAALQSAYTAAVNPPTRGPISIESKNLAIKAMRTSAINLARIIYSTPTVDDSQLMALGLLPRATRTPIEVPSLPPMVEIVAVMGRLVKVRVHDLETERRGLPFGATGANLFTFVGPEAPTDPREYHFEGVTTRAYGEILFPNTVPSGATVWISASWVSRRGQTSIGSSPISFTIQGGAIPAAA